MLTQITLGRGLSRITGRFNAQERQAIARERQQMISDILAGVANSPRQFVSVEEYAQQPEHAGKNFQALFNVAMLQNEPFDDHTFTSYFHRITHPVHLTIDIGQGADAIGIRSRHDWERTGLSLFLDLKSENSKFNISSTFYIGDAQTQGLLHAYWEALSAAPATKGDADVWKAFDEARHGPHRMSYQIFQTAFWEIGIHTGLKLSTDLFSLLAMSMPDSRNPMPQMAADAWTMSRGPRFR